MNRSAPSAARGAPDGRPVSAGATPRPAPLEMPTQELGVAPVRAFDPSTARTAFARLIAYGGAAALTAYGFDQMLQVFGNETRTVLQTMLLALFTVTFGWIAFSATQTVAGLCCAPRPARIPEDTPLVGRTAILMPVYNEDTASTCGALAAMADALAETGEADRFEIFLLSDTRDPQVWVEETAAFARLREHVGGRLAVWYRRRQHNTGRKAGNLRDFIEGWGGRYDYMLVLDADSLMSAETIVEMVRRMDAAPNLGILQTVPMLAGGTTLFARLQQFAGCLYGPVIARGVAAWQGLDGNYWGHNALIRTRAFAENCGLPELPGRMPFGGHVLSHDFVEAALIRRGGWEVRMDPDLGASWEGSPPSLLDLAARDRRWAQGNLQHVKIVGAKGLRLPNRLHFLIGIGAYLMSPIWLAMLLVGMMLTAQTLLVQPQYFPDALQLFPNWPVFDAERMKQLFILAMALLLLPKAVGLLRALLLPGLRRRLGGGLRLVAGTLVEVVMSALYAPILMLLQVRQVGEILLGRDSGWATQSREGQAIPWREAFARHWFHVLAGLVPAAAFVAFAPDQVIWLAPVVAGLILAPLLSRMSGDPRIGGALRRAGLLATPEERETPEVVRAAEEAIAAFEAAPEVDLVALARDPTLRASHVATLGPKAEESETERLAAITARAKIGAAATPEQALGWMTRAEMTALAGSPDLLTAWGMLGRRGIAPDAAAAS